MASVQGINANRLKELNEQLSQLKHNSKLLKCEETAIKEQAIEAMINMRVRYISESVSGDGPYWTLTKSASTGAFNVDRQTKFFTIFLEKCNDPNFVAQLTPESCSNMIQEFLSNFEKRKLVLKLQNSVKAGETFDSLMHWLNGA